MKRFLYVVTILAMFSTYVMASDWSVDIEKARKEAKEKKQKLVVILIGENWGENSIQLSKILEDANFLEALKKYQKVKVPLCQDPSKLSAELSAQLKELIIEFDMMGQSIRLPILLFFDENGRSLCLMQYAGGSAEDMVGNLAKIDLAQKLRDAFLQMADASPDPDAKAKFIDKALQHACQITPLVGYDDLIEKIIELDKDGHIGLRAQYEPAYMFRKIVASIHRGNPKDIRKFAEILIEKYQDNSGVLQDALYYRGVSHWLEQDYEKAIADLTEAVKVDPLSESAMSILSVIDMMKKKMENKNEQ